MLDYINSNYSISFAAKPKLKKVLPQVKNAIFKTLPDIESPNKYVIAGDSTSDTFKELNNRLGFIRAFITTLISDGGLPEHFRGLIGIVQAFKVANCDEFAEITKTVLKANGVKNCDMFELCALKPNSKEQPRQLGHAITAIGVKKSHNNKKTLRPFIPRPNTIIMDTYLDGYIGTAKSSKKKYKIFGLQPDEILMLKPVKTYEPDKASLDTVRKKFPSLVVNKKAN